MSELDTSRAPQQGSSYQTGRHPTFGRGRRLFVSVGIKIGLATTCVLMLVAWGVFFSLSRFEREKLLTAKEQAARMAEQLFLRMATVPVVFEDETGLRDTVSLMAQDPEVLDVELWRATPERTLGKRLAANLKSKTAGDPSPRWVDAAIVERHDDSMIVRDAIRDPDNHVIAVSAVRFSLARENQAYTQLRHRIVMVAVAVAALLALLLRGITRRWILRPIERLLRAIRQVESGEQFAGVNSEARDEVGRLARAFGRMSEAVARRERDIARRNDDMKRVLDNVGQGFLMIDPLGTIADERSAIVDRWFGAPIAGEDIGTYFGRSDENMGGMLAFGLETLRDGIMPSSAVISQFPPRLRKGDQHYACEYHGVFAGEEVRQLVVVITDITAAVERDRAESAQKDLLAAVNRIMLDRAGFLEFLQEASGLVTRIVGPDSDLQSLLRDLHTLKGTTAIFGLQSISGDCHALEDLAQECGGVPPLDRRNALAQAWNALLQKISIFSGTGRQKIELGWDEYNAFLRALQSRVPYGDLLGTAARWNDEPVRPRLQRLGGYASTLAKRLGKCALVVDVDETTVRLPREPWSGLWSTLVHVVRNAVDHGLESDDERKSCGKAVPAHLRLSLKISGNVLSLAITDDGRGIDWPRLREKAESLGMPTQHHNDLVEALFADGVSTRTEVTDTSGRGVGLAAVRHAVLALGGTIQVTSALGQGTRFQFDFVKGDQMPRIAGVTPSSVPVG